jgi:hypothetical protein
MAQFEVVIIPQWPKMKLIINGQRGTTVRESYYDTALANFEVEVRNVLQATITDIMNKRKESR